MSINEIAMTAARREGVITTLKAAMDAWAGLGSLILLFLASLVYVVDGGAFAIEASPMREPETSIAGTTLEPANTDIGLQAGSSIGR